MLKKYLVRNASKLFIISPLFLIQTGHRPVDNLTILNNMVSSVSQQIISRLSPDSSASVLIRSQSQQRTDNWLIENGLAKKLFENGISKIYIDKNDSTSNFVIEYQLVSLGVDYHSTDKKDLIERQFKLDLTVRALEGSLGLVKFVHEFNEAYADSVNLIDVGRIENKDLPFTRADLPEEQGLKKFIEPFIVMTTSAVIIFLFFRLRSN